MTAEVIDYATGEVITTPSTDLVPADNMAALEALEPDAREVAVKGPKLPSWWKSQEAA